jgi:predicted phosphohydrolase
MKLRIFSDLHIEFHNDGGRSLCDSLEPHGEDAVLLAGDIGSVSFYECSVYRDFLHRLATKWPVAFLVAGNHEYYGQERKQTIARIEFATRDSNVIFLRTSKAFEYKGYRWIGDTGWFPDAPDNAEYYRFMSDFSAIPGKPSEWIYGAHRAWRKYLEKTCTDRTIVISHHLPTPQSIDKQYTNSPLNRFFLGDCSDIITKKNPLLWVHGHTHCSVDYTYGATRVVANPFGYPDYPNKNFDANLTVELP